ncbi:XRE family transcriptional regulator [Clostridium butyricum]|jgi:transcriptional regulator with XRE-family HTH domain|uniref:helix-turn-helix domain-containing protein n=1 Tax=Clostridium butyricum TaxID=1492 RepID=UPI000F525270|nr:helix-turn-helix transcriptional regulator [Clostridium butyricum]RQN09839.1 XRE family transcriptional regulator [Clostridium butyricum]
MTYINLGKNIKQERLKSNLTQEQLAEMLGISTSYMGRIERGERNLPIDTLIQISNILNVSIDYLLKNSINIDNNNILTSEIYELIKNLNFNEKNFILDMIRLTVSHFNNK